MSEDPRVKWATLIAVTDGWVSEHDEADAKSDCIQELAAALRAVQERVVELETQLRRWDAAIKFWMGQAKDTPVAAVEKALAREARVAELEPDAKLGRMVREMPIGWNLRHRDPEGPSDEWAVQKLRNDGSFFPMTIGFGAVASAALEAARKGET